MTSSIWYPGVETVDSFLRNNLPRFDEAEFGAGMVGFAPDLAYAENTIGRAVAVLFAELQSVITTVTEGYANIENYGAVGDGLTDCSPAFAAALAENDRIYIPVPEVGYRLDEPVTIPRDGIKIIGESRLRSKVMAGAPALPCFILPGNRKDVSLENFYIGRLGASTLTSTGIACQGYSEDIRLLSLVLENHGDALLVRDGWKSVIESCILVGNNNGIRVVPGTSGFAAWDISKCFSSYNKNCGYLYDASETVAPIAILGELAGSYALYNGVYGVQIQGSSITKLDSARINGGAFSYNGNHNIFLDSYGSRHRISSVSTTAAGTTATGPQGSQTAASLAGSGIRVTANNRDINIVACLANENSYSGIHTEANFSVIAGNTCNNNGKNTGALPAVRSGIRAGVGKHLVQGNLCTNTDSLGNQQVGVSLQSSDVGSRVSGNLLVGNANSLVINEIASTTLQPVTPTASPWVYTAGVTSEVLQITGGNVTSLQLNGGGSFSYHSGALYPLNPGDVLTVTYSTLPTISRKLVF